jgi:type II secretory pathway pseudopilin PulG
MKIERPRFIFVSRRDGGFTLVEALASFAIFGVCFGGLLAGLTWNISNIKFARETVRATQIMEEKLDTIRLYSWDQIMTPGFITNAFQAPFSPASALWSSNSGVTYTGTIAIATAPLTESYATNIMQIKVDLYWPSSPAVRHAQMSTFVSKYGLQGYIY